MKKSRDIIPMILTFFIILAIALLSYTYYLTTPVDKSSKEKIAVEIKESYGSSIIADKLYEKGLIKSPLLFKIYSRLTSSEDFYVGSFNLTKDMTMSDILDSLTNKSNAKSGFNLSIIEGDNILKIAQKVEKSTDISKEEFIKKVNDPVFVDKLKKEFPELITNALDNEKIKYKLEGYLYPAGYELDDNNKKDVELLIRQMVKVSNDRILPLFKQNNKVWDIGGVKMNIDIHDYITMASILEKESTADADNKAIAGVFMNRLKLNMPLQTDPTVYYSVEKSKGALTDQELKTFDFYNTYIHRGLPPGPIAMPSTVSYDALNNYTHHNYIFFVNATKDGKAYFSSTYEEHERLAKEHVEGYQATHQ